MQDRGLWATVAPTASDVNGGSYPKDYGKVLVSWRMLPGDDENTDFDLYRTIG